MTSASLALQQAMFATLAGDETVRTWLGTPPRLLDAPRQGATYPYLVFAADSETNWDTATDAGSEHAIELRVWSQSAGRTEVKTIAEAVRTALCSAALHPNGHVLVDFRHRLTEFVRESDGETVSARLHFRAVTEPQEGPP